MFECLLRAAGNIACAFTSAVGLPESQPCTRNSSCALLLSVQSYGCERGTAKYGGRFSTIYTTPIEPTCRIT
ncbi:hypothetical protein BJX66DRAFT_305869, partial [Aspergillus keveii]